MSQNAIGYRALVSDEEIPSNYGDFQNRLRVWFASGRNRQLLARSKSRKEVIGTIFFYGYNQKSAEIKMSVFFIPNVRKTIGVAESLGAALLFVKDILGANIIIFSVYSENVYMHKMAAKMGAKLMTETLSAMNKDRKVLFYKLSSARIALLISKLQSLYR